MFWEIPGKVIDAWNIPDKIGMYGDYCSDESVHALIDCFMSWDCVIFAFVMALLCMLAAFIKGDGWVWLKWLIWVVCGAMIFICCAVWFVMIFVMITMMFGAAEKKK